MFREYSLLIAAREASCCYVGIQVWYCWYTLRRHATYISESSGTNISWFLCKILCVYCIPNRYMKGTYSYNDLIPTHIYLTLNFPASLHFIHLQLFLNLNVQCQFDAINCKYQRVVLQAINVALIINYLWLYTLYFYLYFLF